MEVIHKTIFNEILQHVVFTRWKHESARVGQRFPFLHANELDHAFDHSLTTPNDGTGYAHACNLPFS